MNISALNHSQALYQNQGITNRQHLDRENDGNINSVTPKGRGHQHGGGGLMQDVLKSLQAIGLSFPGQTVTPPSAPDPTDAAAAAPSSTSQTDPRQALHQLMHDLRQALHQVGSQPTTTPAPAATDSDGDNDNSTTKAAAQNNGYNNLDSKLQSLIAMLGNNATTTDETTATAGITGKLKTDFNNLLQALGNGTTAAGSSDGSTSTTSTAPSLLDFLSNLEKNLGNHTSGQTSPGSLFHVAA